MQSAIPELSDCLQMPNADTRIWVSACRLAAFIHTAPCFTSDVSAAKIMCAGMALGLRCLQESVLWASIILKRILLCHADG